LVMTPEEIKKQATEETFDVEKDRWNREAVTREGNRANALVKAMEVNTLRADRMMQGANTPLQNTSGATAASDFFQWAVGKTKRDKADIGLKNAMEQQGAMQGLAGNLLTAKQEQDAVQVFGKKSKDLLKLTQRMDSVMGRLDKYADGGELEGETPPGISGHHLGQNGNITLLSGGQRKAMAGIMGSGLGAAETQARIAQVVAQGGDLYSQGNEEAQMLKSDITGLINDLVREQSGASATDTERRSVAMSMGFNEFSDPNTFLANLGNLQNKLYDRVQAVRSETHEQVIDTVRRRSTEGFSPVFDWAPKIRKFGQYDQEHIGAGDSVNRVANSVTQSGAPGAMSAGNPDVPDITKAPGVLKGAVEQFNQDRINQGDPQIREDMEGLRGGLDRAMEFGGGVVDEAKSVGSTIAAVGSAATGAAKRKLERALAAREQKQLEARRESQRAQGLPSSQLSPQELEILQRQQQQQGY
jgi:hypothetical protein